MTRYDILQILHPKKGTNCWKMLEFPKGLKGYENLTKPQFYFYKKGEQFEQSTNHG